MSETETLIDQNVKRVTAYAPATSANFAVGFDILGFAIAGVGDRATLIKRDDNQLVIKSITGVLDAKKVPLDLRKNISAGVIEKFLADHRLDVGFDLYLQKGIDLGSGMGGSAASAVSAAMAVNAFLKNPQPLTELIDYAVYGESLVSGVHHADNVVPSMFGGLCLIQTEKPCRFIQLPDNGLYAVVVKSSQHVSTRGARKRLVDPFPISTIVKHSANLAATIAGLYRNDVSLLRRHLDDVLVEPRRSDAIRGFDEVKQAAIANGAIGCGISGSGPAIFALAEDKVTAIDIQNAMIAATKAQKLRAKSWITALDTEGAIIEDKL
ncbi:MAG: homoserine kinase [Francisellaceae bacterium]